MEKKLSVVCMSVDEIVEQAEKLDFRFQPGEYLVYDDEGRPYGCALGFLMLDKGLARKWADAKDWPVVFEGTGYNALELEALEAGFEGYWTEDYENSEHRAAFDLGEALRYKVDNTAGLRFKDEYDEWDEEEDIDPEWEEGI